MLTPSVLWSECCAWPVKVVTEAGVPSLRCYLFRKDNLPKRVAEFLGGSFGAWLDERGSIKMRVDVGLGGEGQATLQMYDGYKEKVSIGRFQKKLTKFGNRAVQDLFELFDRCELVVGVLVCWQHSHASFVQ